MFVLGSLAAILVASRGALAVGSPFGFASGTTGGASAAQAIPTSAAQLKEWLASSTPRNILLDRTYDFTDTEGSVTETGCKPWTCSPNPQLAINANNRCSSSAAKVRTDSNMYFTQAPPCSKNVIIQNIHISDINAQYVWGGDAIGLEGATNIWIDHNYFKNVGRQFIAMHFDPSTKVTISNNYFNGQSIFP